MSRLLVLATIAAAWLLTASPAFASYEAAREALARKDGAAAIREAKDGAEKGDARAQRLLGQLYQRGIGAPKDEREAVRWFRSAADKGDAVAQYELGIAYAEGRGLPKDETTAMTWYRKAADHGLATAQLVVGLAYLDGKHGFKKDEAEAASWVRKSASQGREEAQMLMAVLLFEARGVPRDAVEGYMWISLAAKAKAPKAADMRRSMGKELTAEEKKEANKRVKEWQPSGRSPSSADAPTPPAVKAETREKMVGTGTGFIVSTAGHILTNDHVVKGCKSIRVRQPDDSIVPAAAVATSRKDDLAVLKAELNAEVIAPFRSGKEIRPGDSVVAFGFPLTGVLASSGNLTVGNVTALAGLRNDERFLQISTPIQPGNSGGPLLDMNGRVVGITTSSISTMKAGEAFGSVPQNVNFAVKSEVAAGFLEKHGVSVTTSGGTSRAIKPADVGSRAKRFTVRVECLA